MAPAAMPLNGNADYLGLLGRLQPDQRHKFLQPNATIPSEALQVVKDTLEAFAGQVSDEQAAQLAESRKRKRTGAMSQSDVLKMRKVYVDGFETGQVWQQAKKIIGGVLDHSTAMLDELEGKNLASVDGEGTNGINSSEGEEDISDSEGEGPSEEDMDDDEDLDESALAELEAEEDEDEDGLEDDYEEEFEDAPEHMEDENGEDEEEEDDDEGVAEDFVEDPNGLNDGFFSIDEFNRQTQWFEEQDARGDPETDRVSDEEDIDWDADPMAPPKGSSKKPKGKRTMEEPLSDEGDDDDDDDDEAGPTFGDMDLDAPEGDSEDEAFNDNADGEDDDDGMNANDLFYRDFFAPPAKKRSKNKPPKKVSFQPKEGEVERAMDDVRRDLFEDDSDDEDSEGAQSDVDPGDPASRRSAHERRQAKLADEIRKLEAESIAKRNWTVSGEATAVERPVNSLLEEDLDFEHVGKPVPVITPEVSESIEGLIKRRILAQEFDEVLRRRPGAESVPAGTRRGMLEAVEDSKSSKGLAEVYEEEHIKKTNPDAHVSASDAALQREEAEVAALWASVCGQLDALSNWHYRPKPAAPTISVIADVATIAMEDAQPATAQAIAGGSSRMAPQEVYRPETATAAAGEVVTSAGLPVARTEMSREEKLRRRRRAKERSRKAGTNASSGKPVSKAAATMADLKKGGVRVINRKGEITDLQGNKAKAVKAATSGSFKL
ncbi:U3 small nucleolar ribonucleoprotein complex, subunit Mpp10 [Stachybotrys elegans]|uniref:U3 small nucleolar ribonucleoprotein protein MPP10 n=1 Tax=Stachybotrys elegans TaxID=80388 RepID=A0A8K0SVJ9_9HYPO|nr:U3 small nucleolar ribonucleoprotein complex, subunit Mpp10 [Stachybotrys elegans]